MLPVPVIPTVIPAMIGITPVSRWSPMPTSPRPIPMPTSPRPMVIAPSPTSAYPDVSRGGAGWYGLNDRCRHQRWHDNGGGSHHHRGRGGYNRCWNRDSEADTEMNTPSVYRGHSNSCQGQNCYGLFHNLYWLDVWSDETLITRRLPFCKLKGVLLCFPKDALFSSL
jgi:hypothetical protein